jgi:exopolysaccharide biosynthesis protein
VKRRLVLWCAISFLAITHLTTAQSVPGITSEPENIVMLKELKEGKIFQDSTLNMTLIAPEKPFEFIYQPQTLRSVRQIAQAGDYDICINASYFAGSRRQATHVGWLWNHGRALAPLSDDPQLSHVVSYNPVTGYLSMTSRIFFSPSRSDSMIEFQTGPAVVDSNRIAYESIRKSINGLSYHTRTLLAAVDHTRIYFITVRNPVQLDDLGKILLNLSLFKDKRLDVVNLDGGSSVALYVKSLPNVNTNIDDQLPFLLAVPDSGP